MEATNEAILGWTRVAVLLLGMGWAAWMDHKDRRVPNEPVSYTHLTLPTTPYV